VAKQPFEKWFKSTPTFMTDQVLAGTAAALLTMKKPDKIVPISMLAVSPTFFPDQCEGHGHHLLQQPVRIHMHRDHLTKNVLSLMTKAQAEQLAFYYVDIKAEDGLPNLSGLHEANLFVPPVIPAEMKPTDATDYLVIAFVPIVCPVGYGKECSVGRINDATTTTALQNNH
jgi:hypothetical protein